MNEDNDIQNNPAIRRVTTTIWKNFNSLEHILVKSTPKSMAMADQYFDEGNYLDDQGDLPKALSAFQRCLKKQPNHVGALLALAEIYTIHEINPKESRLIVERALIFATDLNDRLNCLQLLAGLLEHEEKYLSAICRLQEMLMICKTEQDIIGEKVGDIYFSLATCCYKMEDWANSFEYYKVSYKIDDNYPPTALMMAEVSEKQGKWDVALEYYEKASKWDEEIGQFVVYKAYDGTGRVYAQTKKYAKALEIFYKLCEMFPGEVESHIRIISVFARQGDMNMVEKYLKQTIKADKEGQFEEGQFLSCIMCDDHTFHNNKCRDLILLEVYKNGYIPKDEYEHWMDEDCEKLKM